MAEAGACPICKGPLQQGTPCVGQDGQRIRFGSEFHVLALDPFTGKPSGRCPSCKTPAGAFHHAGCRVEECPVCQGSAWSCGCVRERLRTPAAVQS